MSFLVLWSICLSSSLVHFKNNSEYLTKETAQLFIPLMRVLLCGLVLSSSPELLKKLFHLRLFDDVCFQYSQVYVSFLFSEHFGSSIPFVICRFPLVIISMTHFSMPNSIPISSLYLLIAFIKVSNSVSFLANSLIPSIYIRWLIFSCDLWSLYPPVRFLSMCFSDIVAITKSNGDSATPWKVSLGIFTSAKLFPLAVSSTLQFSMVFSINFMTSLDTPNQLFPPALAVGFSLESECQQVSSGLQDSSEYSSQF